MTFLAVIFGLFPVDLEACGQLHQGSAGGVLLLLYTVCREANLAGEGAGAGAGALNSKQTLIIVTWKGIWLEKMVIEAGPGFTLLRKAPQKFSCVLACNS